MITNPKTDWVLASMILSGGSPPFESFRASRVGFGNDDVLSSASLHRYVYLP